MTAIALYLLTIAIWGSTWFVIRFQLGATAPEVSVAVRFLLAGTLLFAWALIRRESLRIKVSDWPWIVAQGIFMYSINYVLVYLGTEFLTSGLIAVLFALMIPFNLVHERLFFKARIESRVALSAVLGIFGVALIFFPEMQGADVSKEMLWSIAVIVVGAWTASLGNMLAIRNMRLGYSIVSLNAFGMVVAGLLTGLYAIVIGRPLTIDPTFDYLWSLAYLAIFGSAIAFGAYLYLLERIGSGRAAYMTVMFPVVALAISMAFENYDPGMLAMTGVTLAILGNALIVGRGKPQVTPASHPPKSQL